MNAENSKSSGDGLGSGVIANPAIMVTGL
jgi:hypothetical protein